MHKKKVGIFAIVLLIIYIPALITIVFFLPPHERKSKIFQHNFIPLKNILTQINNPDQYKTPGYWRVFFRGIIGNILLFVPFGFIERVLMPYKSTFFLYLLPILISVLIEFLQLILHAGVCDVDDVMLNTIGAGTGIFIARLFLKISVKKQR